MRCLLTLSWILITTSISSCQNESKNAFQAELSALLNEKYNIAYLPSGFYDCSYENYLKDGGDNFETGYQSARQCMPDFFSQIRFSDKGAKLLASFEDSFVLKCNELIESHSDQINGADYCKCLHSQYVKYGVGYDDLNDLEFTDGEFYQKMIDFCNVTTSVGDTPKSNVEDSRDAIQDLNKAIELNPKDVFAYRRRGYAKFDLEDYRGAIQDYSKAIELDPEYSHAYFYRGVAKIKLGDKNGGCLDLSKAGELGYDAYGAIRKYCN